MAIQLHRGIEANLTAANLSAAEPAYCTDTKRLLIGNGDGTVNQIPTVAQAMLLATYAAGTGASNSNKVDHAIAADGLIKFARIQIGLNQSIPSGVSTAIAFDMVNYDTDTMWSLINPTRLTIKTAGKYLLMGGVLFGSNATGTRQVKIINSTSTILASNIVPGTSLSVHDVPVFGVYTFSVGDYIELSAYQNSGSALSATVGLGRTYLSAARIGA